jgi:hypothetical protein
VLEARAAGRPLAQRSTANRIMAETWASLLDDPRRLRYSLGGKDL